MRTLVLNMTMSLDGFVAGPAGELDWMTSAYDARLTDDIVTQLRRVEEGFLGYPTAEPMIRYWAQVAADPGAGSSARRIAEAVGGIHAFVVSRSPVTLDVPDAEVLIAPDDAALVAAVNEIKHRPGGALGLPGGVRTAQRFSRLGLIDEYVLLVEPVALGTGRPLFTERTPLTRGDVTAYECGVTRVVLRPSC